VIENWRPVIGYQGRYDVSDQGRVRSWLPHNGLPTPRLLTLTPNKLGYRGVGLRGEDGRRKTDQVHRLVADAFLSPRRPGQQVRHLDGKPWNNGLANLAYGTNADNMRDAVRHGTHPMAKKTHCKHGHEFTPENIVRHGDGHRQCRECKRLRAIRRHATRRLLRAAA
jgi:hypothetical protein